MSGFDHSHLDSIQNTWNENLFPYKLGVYRKKLLAQPVCVGTIHYDLISLGEFEKLVNYQNTQISISSTGKFHCVAIWVDYDITDEIQIKYWDGNNFPPYLKTLLKFNQNPIDVVDNIHKINVQSSFQFGDSEFQFNFIVS